MIDDFWYEYSHYLRARAPRGNAPSTALWVMNDMESTRSIGDLHPSRTGRDAVHRLLSHCPHQSSAPLCALGITKPPSANLLHQKNEKLAASWNSWKS